MKETVQDKSRRWGLRLLALAIAIGMWYGVSLSERDAIAEKVVEATVSYLKPEGLVLVDQPTSVRVRVSGPQSDIRTLAPYLVQVQVDLRDKGAGITSVGLSADDVTLPQADLEVLSIEPNLLTLELDQAMTKTLPLEPSFTGEPAAGARLLLDQLTLDPPRATVTGPAQILEGIESLDLSPISLDGHAIDFTQTATVLTPDPLVQVVGNPRVEVSVELELGGEAPDGGNGGDAGSQRERGR